MATAKRKLTINFVGDVMLGRLIDQLFPTCVNEPSEAKIVSSFVKSHPSMKQYNHSSPWGSTLPLFHSSDLNIMNLETSATAHSRKWPGKVFNYRMHPANVDALKPARIDYASLANNHTLDFCEQGLNDTLDALERVGVACAGAGRTKDEALAPAVLTLPSPRSTNHQPSEGHHDVLIWSTSDHPDEWAKVRQFNLIDYTLKKRARLRENITGDSKAHEQRTGRRPLKIFSVHWGPNYAWHPANEMRSLAHFLIDEAGVDVIHGHSSHHVQGVEKYKGKLIIYGCGDFVDDYALTPGFRNDLSAVWRVKLREEECNSDGTGRGPQLKLDRLEIFPTRIKHFQAQRLDPSDADHQWVCEKIATLSTEYGVEANSDLGPESQLIIDL